MKIAFWSNVRGKAGTTSNLAGISVMNTIQERKKSILVENHFNMNNLESAFVGHHNYTILKESNNYCYNYIGIDNFIKRLHSKICDEKMVENAALSFLNQLIYYIPKTTHLNLDVFEYEFNQVVSPLLEAVSEFADIVYFDTSNECNLSTKIILSESELVVVNINQNPQILEHFFENYQSLLLKAVFLIGNYDPDSKFNLKNIIRKYPVLKGRIGAIPYNVAYKDALLDGTLIEFLSRNYNCTKEDKNYYFIQELKKSTDIITRFM